MRVCVSVCVRVCACVCVWGLSRACGGLVSWWMQCRRNSIVLGHTLTHTLTHTNTNKHTHTHACDTPSRSGRSGWGWASCYGTTIKIIVIITRDAGVCFNPHVRTHHGIFSLPDGSGSTAMLRQRFVDATGTALTYIVAAALPAVSLCVSCRVGSCRVAS